VIPYLQPLMVVNESLFYLEGPETSLFGTIDGLRREKNIFLMCLEHKMIVKRIFSSQKMLQRVVL